MRSRKKKSGRKKLPKRKSCVRKKRNASSRKNKRDSAACTMSKIKSGNNATELIKSADNKKSKNAKDNKLCMKASKKTKTTIK